MKTVFKIDYFLPVDWNSALFLGLYRQAPHIRRLGCATDDRAKGHYNGHIAPLQAQRKPCESRNVNEYVWTLIQHSTL